jgi:hypothetical protein
MLNLAYLILHDKNQCTVVIKINIVEQRCCLTVVALPFVKILTCVTLQKNEPGLKVLRLYQILSYYCFSFIVLCLDRAANHFLVCILTSQLRILPH